tara:strand:+ start:2684 stop:3451 length:768 start_codon:yes stop_codon:yes gene_type:complete
MISEYLEISILAVIQGFFEFLPVSSSAHLILISKVSGFNTSSLNLDISLHLGSLLAVLFYFREELINLTNNKNLLALICLGSIPLIILGYLFYSTGWVDHLRNLKVIAWTTLIFGLILFFADKIKVKKNLNSDLNFKSIFIIGIFQILAIIPGVSRSGIVITASRFLNFDRVDSTKIAFYLSIPALSGASFLGIKDIFETGLEMNLLFVYSIFFSFIISYFTIKFFLIFIKKFSLNFFVFYRVLLSVLLFIIIYQ